MRLGPFGYISSQDDTLIPSADTIVYAVSGRGAIVSEDGKKRQELLPGDFALIPAYVRTSCAIPDT